MGLALETADTSAVLQPNGSALIEVISASLIENPHAPTRLAEHGEFELHGLVDRPLGHHALNSADDCP